MGSRAIYHDGWMASAFGPRVPWLPGLPSGIHDWTPDNDRWELYHLDEDWSQARDLADQMPDKLAQMRELSPSKPRETRCSRSAAAFGCPSSTPNCASHRRTREWEFPGKITRMPEFCAPALGNKNNAVTIDADLPADANGVLYALGGVAGGLTCYLDGGYSATSTTCSSSRAPRSDPRPNCRRADDHRRGNHLCRAATRRTSRHHHRVGGMKCSPRAGYRSARPCCSPQTTAWTLGSALAPRCRWTTTTRPRSRSRPNRTRPRSIHITPQ